MCVSELTNIGSDNGLLPVRRQAIIWTNAATFSIRPSGTYLNEIVFKIWKFSFKAMHLKMSSAKWCPFRLGLNVLNKGANRVTSHNLNPLSEALSGMHPPIANALGLRLSCINPLVWSLNNQLSSQSRLLERKLSCFATGLQFLGEILVIFP